MAQLTRLIFTLASLFLVTALTACNQKEVASAISSTGDRLLAEKALRHVIDGDEGALVAMSEPSVRPAVHRSFAQLRKGLPFNEIQEVTLVSANRSLFRSLRGVSTDQAILAYDIVSGSHHSLAIVSVLRQDRRTSIAGLRIQRIDRPASELNAFRFADVSLENITIFLLMVGSFVTTAAAIHKIWRSDLLRRKWLWTIFSLLGLFSISTFWGVPRLNIEFLKVSFFPVGLFPSTVWTPWWFATTIPVGAIATLIVAHRSAISRKANGEETLR
jgi:hypothetical protein